MKRLRTAAIFLLAGMVASLAVAVLGAAFEKTGPRSLVPITEMRNVWSRYAPADWPEANYGFGAGGVTWDFREALYSGQVRTADDVEWVLVVQLNVTRWRAGWPLRSLVGIKVERMNAAAPVSTHTLLLFEGLTIPYGPIWYAFILNAILYATVFWAPIRGPSAIRWLVRWKRGLCVTCGYPIGDSLICTECGRTLVRQSRSCRG